jgi:branched-chain amino acid aminotransferase
MPTIVSMDGCICAPESAVVSVFDRGFLYGDSVYEVVRAYEGVPFELETHLERLAGSAERIGMRLPVGPEVLTEEVHAALAAAELPNAYVRIVVTRGSGEIGLDTALAESQRRVIMIRDAQLHLPPPELYRDGAEIALVGVRRNLQQAIDPRAKTGNYLNSVMALREARARGAHEAVMLDHRDYVTEGASSNIFVVVAGLILTPPLDAGILEGVTRRVVLAVTRGSGSKLLELPLTADVFDQADEAFITSSMREIVPIVRVDGRPIGGGRPGPITARVRGLFDAYVRDHVAARRRPAPA